MKNTLRNVSFAALLASGALAMPAMAQDAAPENEAAEAASGDEIIVTARRRGESLQDVPLAVTSISGDALQELGTPDITYVAQTVPNTTLEVSRGTNTTLTAFIRGVGQQDPVAGFEAGVGIYIDDVYLNRPQGAVLDIYDVERIEVLRGPQGTLYGRNTIGGAVKYVTKRIDANEPTLNLRGAVGTFNQRDLIVSASTPITDSLRVSAALASLNRDGFGTNLTTGEENYNKEIISARGTVEFEPNERIFVRLTGDYLLDESAPRGGHRTIPGLFSGAPVLDDVFDTRGGIATGPNEVEGWGTALTAEFQLTDTLSLKSISAYRADDTITQIDFDALPTVDVDVPAIYENEQFTQEVQLTYEGDAVQGVAGVFYIDANAFNTFDVVLGATGGGIGLPGLNANTFGDVDTESWAVFADYSFDLERILGWQGFELSLGARYTEDERSARVLRRTYIGGRTVPPVDDPVLIATTSDFEGEASFDNFDPRVSLSYQPNVDHTVYATYSQGFKGGGFDPRGQSSSAPDIDGDGNVSEDEIFDFFLFEPETVNSYELGWKSRSFDGRLTNNIAVFFAEYEDVQIPGSAGGIDPVTGANTFVGVTTNAGAAEFFGLELEGTAILSENLTGADDRLSVNYSAGYIDAEYTEFITLVNGEPQDVSDLRVVQNTPETSGSLQTTYSRPMAQGDLRFITLTSYKGLTNQFEVPNSLIDQPAYVLFDSSLVWVSDDGRYELGLHGKNLFDKEYRVAGYNFLAQDQAGDFVQPITPTLGLEGIATAFYGPPRQVFATLNVRF